MGFVRTRLERLRGATTAMDASEARRQKRLFEYAVLIRRKKPITLTWFQISRRH